VRYSFPGGTDGRSPNPVIFDRAGSLYGTTGSGMAFKLSPSPSGNWTEKRIYTFGAQPGDGTSPVGSLIHDNSENLYGVTYGGGGPGGYGTVFKLTAASGGDLWTETVLHKFTFDTKDGGFPSATLVLDHAGNLYGTTSRGGVGGSGTVFELSPNTSGQWTETVLYAFAGGSDGGSPVSELIFDAFGNLYGTTTENGGGACRCGVVFELVHGAEGQWTENVLYDFQGGRDGEYPWANLVLDSTGNLFGTTYLGGGIVNCSGRGCGTVFELSPVGVEHWSETVLHRFPQSTGDGSQPLGGLFIDTKGKLYGTTYWGGTAGYGTFFGLTP